MDFELLKAVSRSFYLSMVWLPPPMRRGIALGYMLARATDSVADTSTASEERRLQVLQAMGHAVAGTLDKEAELCMLEALAGEMAQAQQKISESVLLQRFGECLRLLRELPTAERVLIQEVLATIMEGQCWDLTFFRTQSCVQHDEQTYRYTYMVAGCVGAFWTRLGRLTMGDDFCSAEMAELMEQAGVRYGQGLQLVNILRDIGEDAARGRSYLSSEPWRWQKRAERFLADGVDYASRLGMFRLRFTALLPALLGQKTLALLAQNTKATRVKISRAAVYASLVEAVFRSLGRRR